MRLELLLGPHLVLGVGNPVVHALIGADQVLVVQQAECQAVVLELHIPPPALLGFGELVAVVEPRSLYAEPHREVDCVGYQIA